LVSVSIIILNWNGKHFLKDCFDSITKQVFKDFEIILVDNGSSDSSIEFVRENYPSVKLIENKKNFGFAEANNIGARHAKGKYLVFLNNDTVVDKYWLNNLIGAMKTDKKLGCCGSKLLYHSKKNVINSIGSFLTVFGLSGSLGDGLLSSDFQEEIYLLAPSGGSMCIRRELFLRLNGFDPDFFAYSEDLDLGWRVWNSGYEIKLIPTSEVYHKYKVNRNAKKNYWITRNTMWAIMKNAAWDRIWLLPLSILTYLVIGFIFILTFKLNSGVSIWGGIVDALVNPRESLVKNNLARKRIIGLMQSIRIITRKMKKYI